MTTEKEQKDQLTVKDPEKAWHVIEDLMLDDEELTVAELDAELKQIGVDPDECLNRIFQVAEKIVRDPNRSGRVSSHASDILSQLSQRHRSEAKPPTTNARSTKYADTRSTCTGEPPKVRAAVSRFYRNYKNASARDRQLLADNEKLLEEKARKLAQKRRTPK